MIRLPVSLTLTLTLTLWHTTDIGNTDDAHTQFDPPNGPSLPTLPLPCPPQTLATPTTHVPCLTASSPRQRMHAGSAGGVGWVHVPDPQVKEVKEVYLCAQRQGPQGGGMVYR